MQQYELTLIVKPDLTEEQADAIIDKLKRTVVHRQVWGKRLLAYPIDKFKEGLYIHVVLEINQSDVASIDEQIRHNDQVIRHLLVRAENPMTA